MIDRRFRRIARGLRTAELTEKARGAVSTLFGFGGRDGSGPTVELRFLDFYSSLGMERAIRAYGIHDRLVNLGLGSYKVHISPPDGDRHRCQLLLDGRVDDEHRVVDLLVTPRRVRDHELVGERGDGRVVPLLYVEWLVLQNPRGKADAGHPLLPGQRYPGLGLGFTFHNILLLMARRLGYEGVVNVPERLHLALMYQRFGYHCLDRDRGAELEDLAASCQDLPLAVVAWAAEGGALRRRGSDLPWTYAPVTMLAPLSRALRRVTSRPRGRLGLRRRRPARSFEVDVELLRRWLTERPVPGLDPSRLP